MRLDGRVGWLIANACSHRKTIHICTYTIYTTWLIQTHPHTRLALKSIKASDRFQNRNPIKHNGNAFVESYDKNVI